MNDLYVSELTVSSGTYKIRDKESYNRTQNLVFVENYGAIGDGITDCTEAIQTAINENPFSKIKFKGGKYMVTSSIQLTDFNGCCLDLGGCVLFAGAIMDSILIVSNPNGVYSSNMIINGTIDADNKANYCILLKGYVNMFENLTLLDPIISCVNDDDTSSSPQKIFNNIYCGKKDSSPSWSENSVSIAMILSHDCILNNIHIGRFQKGIKFTGEDNLINNVHIWTQFKQSDIDVNVFNMTQAIIFKDSLSISNFYLDNFKYGIVSTNNGAVIVYGLYVLQIGVTSANVIAYIVKDVSNYKLDIVSITSTTNIRINPELNKGYISYAHNYADIKITAPSYNEPLQMFDLHDCVTSGQSRFVINGEFAEGQKLKIGTIKVPSLSLETCCQIIISNRQYGHHIVAFNGSGNNGSPTVDNIMVVSNPSKNSDYGIGIYAYTESPETGYNYTCYDIYIYFKTSASISLNVVINKVTPCLAILKDTREDIVLVNYTGKEIDLN